MQENKKAKRMMGASKHYRARLLSLSRSEGGQRLSTWEAERERKNSHWDIYTRDVTAITVRAGGSPITLDLPT